MQGTPFDYTRSRMKDAITVVICALSLAYVLKDSVCRWMDRKEASLHRQMKEQGYL